ncbi:MAG: PAS domain S-box protein [Bacteroidetes bacterium]|nr:PAS domain S-box protein [Bacteroidota bacterium]
MHKISILIVEDDKTILESLRSTLFELEYTVLNVANTGETALEILKEVEPDVILMDISLPGEMNGINTVSAINTKYDIPIIYLTAHDDDLTFKKAIQTEPYGYVLKPYNIGQLKVAIDLAFSKHQVEKKLKQSETKYRNLFETMDQGVVYQDKTGRIVSANPTAESILGLSFEKMVNLTSNDPQWDSIRPDGSPFPGEEHPAMVALNSGKPVENIIMGIRNIVTEDIKWITIDAMPLFKDDDSEPYQVYTLFKDITEKVALDNERRKLHSAVEQSSASIIITDTEGTIEYVNPSFEKTTGYPADEVYGKKPNILRSEFTPREEYENLWTTIKSGKDWRGEFYNIKKNGSCYWERAVISPVFNDKGIITNFLAVKDDITENKRKEEELIVAKDNAEKSDRLKTEFLAQMSHEIRTPINNILTFISLLKEEFENKLPDELQSSFHILDSSSKRLIRTIELILNMSRIQTGNFDTKFECLDLFQDFLDDIVLEFYTNAKEKGLSLNFNNNIVNSKVFVDKFSFGQIFMNLLGNAIKYTREGFIDINVYNKGARICIEVKDSGIGISKEYLPKLFEPFSQEETGYTRRFEGTGLGLSLVKRYAEINNAELSVESEIGVGTIFKIVIDSVVETT